MDFRYLLFLILSSLSIFGALLVITSNHPVRAVLALVFTFVITAMNWLVIETEFLALALILVYVGAVMVLFLFVVMMLDVNLAKLREGFWAYLPLGGLVAVL